MVAKLKLFFGTFFELLVGCMLLVSGLIHLSGPYFFLETAIRYQILSPSILVWLLPILVALQFILGICLLARFTLANALLCSGVLFLLFALAQISVLIRGISTGCGCFGSQSEIVGFMSVAKLLALSFGCLAFGNYRSGQDFVEVG